LDWPSRITEGEFFPKPAIPAEFKSAWIAGGGPGLLFSRIGKLP
jgi:hypothetical protein